MIGLRHTLPKPLGGRCRFSYNGNVRSRGNVKRWIVKSTAVVLLLLLMACLLFPWFAQCKGRSLKHTAIRVKLVPLIKRYKAETGAWPKSWGAIQARYQPDLDFKYVDICDRWPYRRTSSGSLEGLQLRPLEDPDRGLGWYEYKEPKVKVWLKFPL